MQVGVASFAARPYKIFGDFVAYLRENGLRARDLRGRIYRILSAGDDILQGRC